MGDGDENECIRRRRVATHPCSSIDSLGRICCIGRKSRVTIRPKPDLDEGLCTFHSISGDEKIVRSEIQNIFLLTDTPPIF